MKLIARTIVSVKTLIGLKPPPPSRKRPRLVLSEASLEGMPHRLLKEIDSYDTKSLSLRSVCRWTRAILMIPAALLAMVSPARLRSLERGAAHLGMAPLAEPAAVVVQEQSWLAWLRALFSREKQSGLACRKGCGRCFGNAGARGTHESACDGTPRTHSFVRPAPSQHLLAVYSRALRAGLPTTGLLTAANGYKNKSKAGVPQCRCNDRERTKCLKPKCPKFGVPKQGSPGNWHHP